MAGNSLPGIQLDAKNSIRQILYNFALKFNYILFICTRLPEVLITGYQSIMLKLSLTILTQDI